MLAFEQCHTERKNERFSTLRCTKTGDTQPKLSATCFVVQSCLADADCAAFSNYCLIGTWRAVCVFCSDSGRRSSPRRLGGRQRSAVPLRHAARINTPEKTAARSSRPAGSLSSSGSSYAASAPAPVQAPTPNAARSRSGQPVTISSRRRLSVKFRRCVAANARI